MSGGRDDGNASPPTHPEEETGQRPDDDSTGATTANTPPHPEEEAGQRPDDVSKGAAARGVEGVIGGILALSPLVWTGLVLLVAAGLYVAPFDWDLGVERDPVPVDAIPDLGENQQIVFTEWAGRSPQDVEDQVTYPLTVALLGLPDVRTIRSTSAFGFSSIYVVFDEGADFYDSRSRIVERLASLPAGTLPDEAAPQLGPDATPLGQVVWYTLEGRDADGDPAGGWDLDELRAIQDFQVRYALAAVDGVAEVASVGGFVRELVVDVDPDAMRAAGVSLAEVARAVQGANSEIGARNTEINGVEYVVRSTGFVETEADVASAVVRVDAGTPLTVGDVARVSWQPAQRRGALDIGGAEAVGGVVTARYGENPLAVIDGVHAAIDQLAPALPSRTLADGTVSQVTVVPFYDRSDLIGRTLGTLETALSQQLWISLLVVLVMLLRVRAAALVTLVLPLGVLATFVAMRVFGVDANVVSLAGIAIAIGTMVDLGIVLVDAIVEALDEADDETPRHVAIRRGVATVAPAVLTAALTTVISFLPVFLLQGAEGRLFTPLAFTKTAAILAAALIALLAIPVAANLLLHPARTLNITLSRPAAGRPSRRAHKPQTDRPKLPILRRRSRRRALTLIVAALLITQLAATWSPLGLGAPGLANLLFVAAIALALLGGLRLFAWVYPVLLDLVLRYKALFLTLPATLLVAGLCAWLGFGTVFGPVVERLPPSWQQSRANTALHHAFPGLGSEFMPQLDEGSFLVMPSTMPHASLPETMAMMAQLDRLIETVPEVERAVGKLGRAETALDPAPVSMIETIVELAPEYVIDDDGRRLTFAVDDDGAFVRDDDGQLVPDPDGRPYRNWRDEIRSTQDVWDEIAAVAVVPGMTAAPYLQPIAGRIVMLQSGIRAPMAIRLSGPSLETLAEASLDLEAFVRTLPMVAQGSVNADRPVGKPYLVLDPRRDQLARHGLTVADLHAAVGTAIGGRAVTQTVDGREHYDVRVRYPRELRDTPQAIERVLIDTSAGAVVPLADLATVRFERGPQAIRSEDAGLVTYVLFSPARGVAEVDAVEAVRAALDAALAEGDVALPDGVHHSFAGTWENAERARKRLSLLIPGVLVVIAMLLYVPFRSGAITVAVFSGVAVAWAGGFVGLWLVNQPGFLDVTLAGVDLREVFHIGPTNLSVAVWVGFIALFGIATDDGVVMAAIIRDELRRRAPADRDAVRATIMAAGQRRIRACLMTTATTIFALLPVLTSSGTGADVMIPMALPLMGGMAFELLTLFVVPCLVCMSEEWRVRRQATEEREP